ncbi:MAG: tRNA (N6-isopentenyl adenosine(37)-C2)-methylthiotransferase MiaB [Bacteroidales bacterium]|jgi:tRNA-2-methylthio-N6-dimethylallyladenosine synthase|nr:tRNA (N6-isopentenyl adenosine(37)-C2)-methylthiotransferase MiaB [Bacteroidales bacterium]MBO7283998.1 tRNA (N6-isopentenyl adenosine(37)-C2)-methylthiotransferase MiaB [Bacteroidales bacterium]MBQ1280477.1 tRNA (N6-isopentenyl adenosine(37)-C2)-methylthiotransferase MiaB [Bacteroidales bacterium]MBQ5747720.1 tRNA (N6-isopentenyl adenosine(37)-C2)-methylthiotransferase MiaB [Bacteroidales bacterium]MBQ5881353.1 tRNA (N6-isopentenyl adenosine(37)-C2)-methylthiotransferase MiaB [Bacteroidales
MQNLNLFIETYGCQMNVYDSEVVLSILKKEGYELCDRLEDADLILVNTCSIRENAEQRVWGRLDRFLQEKKHRKVIVGVLGCMAERIKQDLLSHPAVDMVVGPDSYRELPKLLEQLSDNSADKQMEIELSRTETYADIVPVRMDKNGVTSFISIMRGCNNMCTYCIVPYVRGRERSRDPYTIVQEATTLYKAGYKEVNLLGQNVDSYLWKDPENPTKSVNFAQLLELVALVAPDLRVRFSTSHPKDMSNGVLYSMAMYPNICTHIHLPVQSGSDRMLDKMNRKYDSATYLERIDKIREIIPDAAITTDIIAGFCSETEEDHQATIELLKKVRFDSAFMFQYSQRPNTKAARHFDDDVPLETKTRRLNEIIELQSAISLERNKECIGKTYEVLIEGTSKRDSEQLFGRTLGNKVCVFSAPGYKAGDYATVKVESCTSATLIATLVK